MNSPVSFYQLWHLLTAHFKEIIRQPAVIFWGVIFPILISLGLGMAFTQKTETIYRVGIAGATGDYKNDKPLSVDFFKELNRDFVIENAPGSQWQLQIKDQDLGDTCFLFFPVSWHQAMVLIKRGELNLVIDQPEEGKIRYHFDPANPEAELAYLKLSAAIDGKAGAVNDKGLVSPLAVAGTRYIDFLIPGLIGMIVMMSCMWGVSYGMIDKRSKKLLRRMVATPMKKSHFLVALMAVRIFMNIIEVFLLFIVACLVFDITIQGSAAALVCVFFAGNIAFCGIAVFTSSRTANTEVGNGLVNAVVMPMTVLSGIFFSYHNFPDWSIAFIRKLPLTMFIDAVRSIFNEGAGFAETGLAVISLTAVGIIFFSLGLRIFRWH
jgi:ABC-type multidrug transport system permease subunit